MNIVANQSSLLNSAYGEAASYCLNYYSEAANATRLCALVAYYPNIVPDTRVRFPFQVRIVVHLAGQTVDVTTTPVALGLQGKRRQRTRALKPGVGTGERLKWAYPAFTYDQAHPGFAEHDMEEYNHIAAGVAWSRSINALRKGFSRDIDIEKSVEEHEECGYTLAEIDI